MILAEMELARCPTPFAAYVRLQARLLARWVAQGESEADWAPRVAAVYARRYRWVLEQGSRTP